MITRGQKREIAGGRRKILIAQTKSKKNDVPKTIFPIEAVMKKQNDEMKDITVERRALLIYFILTANDAEIGEVRSAKMVRFSFSPIRHELQAADDTVMGIRGKSITQIKFVLI